MPSNVGICVVAGRELQQEQNGEHRQERVALFATVGRDIFRHKTGWEISRAAIFLTATTNTAANYRSGDMAHFDFAFGKALAPQFKNSDSSAITPNNFPPTTELARFSARADYGSRVWGRV